MLSDYTNIDMSKNFVGRLLVYKEAQLWELRNIISGVPAKLPGKTEFTLYRSITLRPDWGEFIEGELWE
jgi:hypothetical protein